MENAVLKKLFIQIIYALNVFLSMPLTLAELFAALARHHGKLPAGHAF